MTIFNNDAYISADAAQNFGIVMRRTHPRHILPYGSADTTAAGKAMSLNNKLDVQGIPVAGGFDTSLLQALDKVSGAQMRASAMAKEAIIDPDSVDAHDISIAQAEATMSLNITRNVLNRLVQGWRDLINTR